MFCICDTRSHFRSRPPSLSLTLLVTVTLLSKLSEMSHMAAMEIARVDRMHKLGIAPLEILKKLRKTRASMGATGPSESAVRRFLSGDTYKRGVSEQRLCSQAGRGSSVACLALKARFPESGKLWAGSTQDFTKLLEFIHLTMKSYESHHFTQCPYSARTVPVQCPYSAHWELPQCPYFRAPKS